MARKSPPAVKNRRREEAPPSSGTTWSATVSEQPATGTASWSLALPAFAPGAYSVRATAIDGAGNRGASAFLPFIITGAAETTPSD